MRQLTCILGDSFPKYVIRTDIEAFYESIKTEDLLKTIDSDAFLTLPSRRMIRQILAEYQNLPGKPTGLPRGVGISAYLSELYMRKFDEHVRAQPAIIFYARYVDDIILVFSPEPNSSVTEFLPFVRGEAAALGLTLNAAKTFEYDVNGTTAFECEYLGYKIRFGHGAIKVGLSDKRKLKYERRIIRSFETYRRRSHVEERKARRLLIGRIKFLTGNTRLRNNKENILVGSFFSNSLISDPDELKSLDDILKAETATIGSASLRARIGKHSFQNGFTQRSFHKFSTRELSRIVKAWKHEA